MTDIGQQQGSHLILTIIPDVNAPGQLVAIAHASYFLHVYMAGLL